MDKKSIKNFNQLCQFINCRGFDDFKDMYIAIGLCREDTGNQYVEEKHQIAMSSFILWWTNIDEDCQMKILNYIDKFYNK